MHPGAPESPFDGDLGLPDEVMRSDTHSFCIVTWNTGGLLPSVVGAIARHAVKRRFFQKLLDSCDILATQETRGVQADIAQLPLSHRHLGLLQPPRLILPTVNLGD